MDVHVIYFDESKQKVVRAYIGTSFMGHATHEDTVKLFVKPEVLAKKTSAKGKMGINLVKESSSKGTSLKEENLLSIEKVKIGHGAERIIRKMKTVDALEVKKFRTSCRLFLVTLVEKLKEDHHHVIL